MTNPSNDPEFQEPAQIRFLRRLVTILTAVMIFGLVAVVTLLVIRLSDRATVLPDNIALPGGVTAQAVTIGDGWYAVVTNTQEILIFDAGSGEIQQRVAITAGE